MTRDELLRRYADGERNFDNADLRGVDLSDAYLNGARLLMADLRGANLSNANLCNADLGGADLRGANLRSVKMISADLFMCKFERRQATSILIALGMVWED